MAEHDYRPRNEEEHYRKGQLYAAWQDRCCSKEYCLSKIPKSADFPSEGALLEANAVVDEQELMAKDLNPVGLASSGPEKAKKLSANACIEQYAFAVYDVALFEHWHILRYYENIPERKPTMTERLRFEKLFYQIMRFALVSEERFDHILKEATYNLADLNRLENLSSFFVNYVPDEHDLLAFFRTPQSIANFLKLNAVRSKKGPIWDVPKGVSNIGMWAIFDEAQAAVEYDCAGDKRNRGPAPPDPWK